MRYYRLQKVTTYEKVVTNMKGRELSRELLREKVQKVIDFTPPLWYDMRGKIADYDLQKNLEERFHKGEVMEKEVPRLGSLFKLVVLSVLWIIMLYKAFSIETIFGIALMFASGLFALAYREVMLIFVDIMVESEREPSDDSIHG